MPSRNGLVTGLAFLVSSCTWQSPSEIQTRTAAVPVPAVSMPQPQVERILSALAHDSMEGRKTGTPGADRAAAFIAAEMKAIGLSPAGDSAYFQKVPLRAQGSRLRLLDNLAALD